jgi:hypothetical protein
MVTWKPACPDDNGDSDRPQWSIKSAPQPEAILLKGDATFLQRQFNR